VKRTGGIIYEESRGDLRVFLEDVLRNAVTYVAYDRRSAQLFRCNIEILKRLDFRKTMKATDVVRALQRRSGTKMYGFGV